jgi:hypothetical protein
MAFSEMAFSPTEGLRDTAIYPKQPSSETEIRDAIQDQADQLRDFLNTLVAGLNSTTDTTSGASQIGSAAIAGVDGTDVHAQLLDLKEQLDSAVLGEVVITDLIDTGDITTNMLATDAVTQDKIADDAVGTDQIEDAAVTPAKLSTSYLPLIGGILTGNLNLNKSAPIITMLDTGVDTYFLVNSQGNFHIYKSAISWPPVLHYDGTNWKIQDQKVWHAGNDGLNSGLDADKIRGKGITIGATAPESPIGGDAWLDTTIPGWKYYDGSTWVTVG